MRLSLRLFFCFKKLEFSTGFEQNTNIKTNNMRYSSILVLNVAA
ncbi:hypothetical protein HMPREF0541_01359 [Lacticaseibacillus rhamnosus ATCC 21052]|nr:hypothetical protein HMPREF0541_01359 [Lacticaseibacillus rhamnosus ATCC 21052]